MALYSTDYVLVDIKTKKPIESYNIINHFSSIISEYNNHLLSNNIEYISMDKLTKQEQTNYLNIIKKGNK
jgi:hypothetical protein